MNLMSWKCLLYQDAFCPKLFDDAHDEAAALDANSTVVEFTTLTLSGDLVIGEDSIKIAGN